ncbi:MAG: DUF4238 domain-containing protein [Inquilinus sp.]|uniref:DUF4238 domain-containing protein n=1 Tax=Inquilinus sp. TaxID=1932117 RepID=UPI003F39ADDE
MSAEGDHHYVPQFHLRKWAGPDGKIVQWGRIPHNGKLVRTPVASAQTAYVPGLYSLKHVLPEEVRQIETQVFGTIETQAAPILDKLIAYGPAALSVKERYWWTMYLRAAVLRVPRIVEMMKSDGLQLIQKELLQAQGEFEAVKGNAQEKTFWEWALNHDPGRIANFALKVMAGMLNGEAVIDRIIHLEWIVRDVSSALRPLLLGDDPFERIGGLFEPRTLISIPLSPTHVFFGTDARDVAEGIRRRPADEIADASNISTLTTAKKFAYGKAERAFVDRHLLRSDGAGGS